MEQKKKTYFTTIQKNKPQSHFDIVKHCQTILLTATLPPRIRRVLHMENKIKTHMKQKHQN